MDATPVVKTRTGGADGTVMRRGITLVAGALAAACFLAGCAPASEVIDAGLDQPVPPVLDDRVVSVLMSATDLGFTEDDQRAGRYVRRAAAVLPDCGLEAVAVGGVSVWDGRNTVLEKAFVFRDKSDAREFYAKMVEGGCSGWPKLPSVDLPSVGDRSYAYAYEQRDVTLPASGNFGAWILEGISVLHVVTQQDEAVLKEYSVAAADAARK